MVLEFWFEFGSTYSYPTAMRIEGEAARAGVKVRWRPFLLGPIFKTQGWNDSPFNLYPAKGRYMWRDLERICGTQGLTLKRPSQFPRNGLLAARIAACNTKAPWLPEFVRAVYTANFARDEEISDKGVLARCLDAAGEKAAPRIAEAESEDAKAKLRSATEEAQRRGIFGAPSFWVAPELFWGNDRLEEALAWAQRRPGAGPSYDQANAIRRARPAEASRLSDIAFRSKAHWGYDDAFMESCRDELAISPLEIRSHPVFVLEGARGAVGFYSLERQSATAVELNHLFVRPERIGQGGGSALLEHAISTARSMGFRTLVIQSDPNALGFYTARGATRVGERPSDSIPGRSLPVLQLNLDSEALKHRAESAARPGRVPKENESGRGR